MSASYTSCFVDRDENWNELILHWLTALRNFVSFCLKCSFCTFTWPQLTNSGVVPCALFVFVACAASLLFSVNSLICALFGCCVGMLTFFCILTLGIYLFWTLLVIGTCFIQSCFAEFDSRVHGLFNKARDKFCGGIICAHNFFSGIASYRVLRFPISFLSLFAWDASLLVVEDRSG